MQFYQEIEECLQQQQPMSDIIMGLYASLMPKRKFRATGLTQQQSLSLVYEHMRAPLNKLKQQIENKIKDNQQVTDEDLGNNQEPNQGQYEENQNRQQQEQQEQQNEQQGNQQNLEEQMNDNQQQEQYNNEEQDHDNENINEGEMGSEDDIGLYGQQMDEEDMESYENQSMDDDPQFGGFKLNKLQMNNQDGKGEEDQFIQDNFDQFRQIQRENQANKTKQEPTQIQKQIEKLEQRIMGNKNWVLGGEIKAKERPVNSLLDTELDFKSGIKYSHDINETYNTNLQAIIKQRILDEIFDDRIRFIPNASLTKKRLQDVSTQKSNKGLAELYEIEFKDSLGLGGNKNEKLKKDILDSLKQINYYLDSLSNTGFALKPVASTNKNGASAIIVEDKVPITSWNGVTQAPNTKLTFQSDKQINKKTVRLRNKRNARQRKKEQDRKKTNRAIQYGGVTKFQAEARKKIAKSKQNVHVKYSKSSQFFKNINDKTKAGKPNPNISKLKI